MSIETPIGWIVVDDDGLAKATGGGGYSWEDRSTRKLYKTVGAARSVAGCTHNVYAVYLSKCERVK